MFGLTDGQREEDKSILARALILPILAGSKIVAVKNLESGPKPICIVNGRMQVNRGDIEL